MSALSSGNTDLIKFYKITNKQNNEFTKGSCYIQLNDICWYPERASTIWTIVDSNNQFVTIQANTGGPNKARRLNNIIRNIPIKIFKSRYKYYTHQRQLPPF